MTNVATRIVTFGEIMARMAPQGMLRLSQSLPGSLDVTFAGAEANVAAALALWQIPVSFVTALPHNSPLTAPCLATLRGVGVDVDHIRLPDDGRFGIYFVEAGANQRPGCVFYDREHSSISRTASNDFNWHEILTGGSWLHLTGITPGLSASAAAMTLSAAESARDLGVRVSFDVNFRSKLWRWDTTRSPEQLAAETLRRLLPLVDLLFAGAEDARLLGVDGDSGTTSSTGNVFEHQLAAAKALAVAYPNLQLVASSLRVQHSASHNDWGGTVYNAADGRLCVSPLDDGDWSPYEIRSIVDRVGSGDAFVAGLLAGLVNSDWSLQQSLDFATAAGCLAHSVVGDWCCSTREEVVDLVHGSRSGRIRR